ncbi:MAG TPA: calcium/sodium antiporter [Anaerolineales bacterium]|nr:calcium/sodium antiporter [Anaerolineales bacterium]
MTTILLFVGGLITLIVGAEFLVRGATRLAAAAGISPLVIGLTIVAVGTASPEIAVSLQAAAIGQGDLTLGNVLGSNIFNLLFILGVTAMIRPLVIAEQLIRLDTPILIGISLFVYVLAVDGSLRALEGALLLIGLITYIIFVMYQSKRESKAVQKEYAQEFGEKEKPTRSRTLANIAFVAAGFGMLVIGARWLVEAAIEIARALGISELVIGLTIVAIGTSLPEIATSLIAALKRESDIAVGNAIGSNIFNLLGVLGLASVVAPGGIPVARQVLLLDFLVMLGVAFLCWPILYVDKQIQRWEGALLFLSYVIYTTYLLLGATQSPAILIYSVFALVFVLAAIMIVTRRVYRTFRNRQLP